MSSGLDEADALLTNTSASGEETSGLLYPDPWLQPSSFADSTEGSCCDQFGIVLNLVNILTGPSLLLAPFAFSAAGAVGGVVILIITLALQMLSIYCLVVSAHLSGRASYRGLVSHFISRSIPRIADFASFLFAFAVIVLHFIVLRDVVPRLLYSWSGSDVGAIVFLSPFCVVMLPIILFSRQMTQLVIPSVVAFCCTLYLAASLIYAASSGAMMPTVDPGPVDVFKWGDGIFICISIFIFVFTPQLVFFPIMRTHTRTGTIDRRLSMRLTAIGCFIGAALYIVIGLCGYFAVHNPSSNILLDMPITNVVFQVAVVVMLINLVLNFGLFAFAARESLDCMVFGRSSMGPSSSLPHLSNSKNLNSGVGAEGERDALVMEASLTTRDKLLSMVRITLESLAILGCALILTVFIEQADLRSVAGISGATLCMLICFFLPALFYMRAWMSPSCCLSWKHVLSVYAVGMLLVCVAIGGAIACSLSVVRGIFLY